jgi:hypothetical protein
MRLRFVVFVSLAASLFFGTRFFIRAEAVVANENLSQSIAGQTSDYLPAEQAGSLKHIHDRVLRRSLYPYNMHLTSGATSAVRLVVRDEAGNPLNGQVYFYGYDNSLISVDSLGYVHALRAETDNEIGTWVAAQLDGQEVQNSCVVRVLSQDYGWEFAEVVGAHTVLYYPITINGEEITPQVELYQIPLVDEYAYNLQASYMGLFPFDSAKQIIEIDFGESETQRVCGISGNPFRLGWNINGDAWRNCFLVPFLPPRSPQWFVIYHEIGHNFTWPSYTFGYGLGPLWHYSEGLASTLAMVVMQEIRDKQTLYPINEPADTSLGQVLSMQRSGFNYSFEAWLDSGAPFADLDPNIVDAIWLQYYDSAGVSFARRFYLPLQPRFQGELMPLLDSISAHDLDSARHTFFVALVGAAFHGDLSYWFESEYHYPVVRPLHDFMYEKVFEIMNRNEIICGDADNSHDIDIADAVRLVCYIFSGCVAPPIQAADSDCDSEVTIADAVYLVNYIFSHGSAPCAACK